MHVDTPAKIYTELYLLAYVYWFPLRPPMPDYSRIQYPLFDWLRIILASLVFVQHAQVTGLVSPGNFAVQIFFALSGWLIGGILLKMPPAGLPRFFYDRATRIWIPYLPAVAAIYILTLLKDGGSPYFL
ncbi:acyltransferase family protein, partial [Paracoccus sp. (in: a-proteobacteria)]|uniref:acyltransferase family protein n=1 Tax=Paracoccus sp. TaxID=267 RepID=UPI003A87DD86